MTAKQLTDSILQLAIQGKLVPHDSNDEPASVLIEKISKEKRKLVKEGVLKKRDLEEKTVNEEDVPFVIPDGWVCASLKSLSLDSADGPFGSNLKKEHYTEEKEVRIIQLSNIGERGWRDSNVKYTTYKHLESIKRSEAFPGDIIIAKMMPAGRAIICPNSDNKYVLSSDAVRFNFSSYIYKQYLYYAINSDVFKSQVYGNVQGITRVRTSLTKLRNYFLPIPPLAEQHRIVQRIEEILPIVKEYGEAYEEASKMDAELPDKLKKSILQDAIMGKLGTQDPNDEPASVLLEQIRAEKKRLVKEGVLKKKDLVETPIEEENYPYTLPENWKWVRLQDITTYISRGKSPIYSETRKYPIVAQKCNQWSGFSLEKAKFADPKTIEKYAEERLLKDGDLLWNSTGIGTLGRMAIYDSIVNEYGWAAADSHVTVIRTRPDFAYYKYLYFYFASPEVQSVIEDKSDGSTKQKELAQNTVKMYEVPLPPLAEQHRIVLRIEELYAEIANMTINNYINETEIEETEE